METALKLNYSYNQKRKKNSLNGTLTTKESSPFYKDLIYTRKANSMMSVPKNILNKQPSFTKEFLSCAFSPSNSALGTFEQKWRNKSPDSFQ